MLSLKNHTLYKLSQHATYLPSLQISYAHTVPSVGTENADRLLRVELRAAKPGTDLQLEVRGGERPQERPLRTQLVHMNGALKMMTQCNNLWPTTPGARIQHGVAVLCWFHFVLFSDHLHQLRCAYLLAIFQNESSVLILQDADG